MKNTLPHLLTNGRKLILLSAMAMFAICTNVSGQNTSLWNINGNSTGNGNFLGTTNNEPLIFKTNNLEALRIKPNGEIKIASFENQGKGIVTFNNHGVLTNRVFPNDTNQVFCGSGNFKSVAALSGWTRTGNVLYNAPGVKVGIGTSNPSYALDVVGSANFTGTVSAQGVILTNKLLADTMKAGSMFSLNNNLHMSAGGLNEIYTSNGDLRFQSDAGNHNNVIFNAGTSGNVGIGTFSPTYKLDVVGTAHFNDAVYVARIKPQAGDSIIAFGDSSILLMPNQNRILWSANAPYKGLGIGQFTYGFADYSVAIGRYVKNNAGAINSVTIGCGVGAAVMLTNNTANSFAVGFQSNIPTFFVGSASGNNTVGRVGIGTTAPQYTLDVNGTINASQFLINGNPLPQTLWTVSGDDVFFDQGATSGGSVGIGVNGVSSFYGCPTSVCPNGKYLLAVAGGIRAKSLKIEPLWSDYVFDSTYQLMPLDSVEAFIQANGHLPGVQTAAEVAQNGTDVGETQAMLLAKIEELTLYMIEIKAQNDALKTEVELLKQSQPK